MTTQTLHLSLTSRTSSSSDGGDKPGKPPHGGLWRAFVRQETLGTHEKPRLADVAKAYHEAKGVGALEHLKPMATLATVQGRLGSDGRVGSAFGRRGRDLTRSLARRREEARKRELRHIIADTTTVATGSLQPTSDFDIALQVALRANHNGNKEDAASEGQATLRALATLRSDRRLREMRQARAWCASTGKLRLEQLEILPGMKHLLPDTVQVPSSSDF